MDDVPFLARPSFTSILSAMFCKFFNRTSSAKWEEKQGEMLKKTECETYHSLHQSLSEPTFEMFGNCMVDTFPIRFERAEPWPKCSAYLSVHDET